MTISRVPRGVSTGGQFAASAKVEAGVALPVDRLAKYRVAGNVREEIEMLISREATEGAPSPVLDVADVTETVRTLVPNVSREQFDAYMERMVATARIIGEVEAVEGTDTEAYERHADAAGIEMDDYPANIDDYEPGDGMHSLRGYQTAVIDYYGEHLDEITRELAEADLAAQAEPAARATA